VFRRFGIASSGFSPETGNAGVKGKLKAERRKQSARAQATDAARETGLVFWLWKLVSFCVEEGERLEEDRNKLAGADSKPT